MRRNEEKMVQPALLVIALVLLVVGVVIATVVVTGGDGDPAEAASSSTSTSLVDGTSPADPGDGTDPVGGTGSDPSSTGEAPPLEPIELVPEVLDEAVANATSSFFPQLASADREELGTTAVTACELTRAADRDGSGTSTTVVDAIVAAIPPHPDVPQYTAGAIMILGRYLAQGGCGPVPLAAQVAPELFERVGSHMIGG